MGAVVEGQNRIADRLRAFVTLAGDHQHVARFEPAHRPVDGRGTGADVPRARTARHHLGANGGRVLAARVVVGDDREIGKARGDFAHDRPLAGVAVAAAAEDDEQPAARVRAQRVQDVFERIGRMGLVEIDRSAASERGGAFGPAGHALERGQGVEHAIGNLARGDRDSGGAQRVVGLELGDER